MPSWRLDGEHLLRPLKPEHFQHRGACPRGLVTGSQNLLHREVIAATGLVPRCTTQLFAVGLGKIREIGNYGDLEKGDRAVLEPKEWLNGRGMDKRGGGERAFR